MRSIFIRLLEVLLIRAAPGLVNFYVLLLIGGWLTATDYGVYSTIVVTAGFFSNMFFGVLTSSVVSQHADLEVKGRADAYEASLVSGVLLMAASISLVCAIAAILNLIRWVWIAPAVAFGVYTAVQEILRARLRFWRFGFVSLAQSLMFLLLSWLMIRARPNTDIALNAFAASYAFAALISLVFSGVRALRWPEMRLLAGTLHIGGTYTFSTMIEQGLYLGTRYLIGYMGTPQQLGTFSFCVDIAQRFIGFMINAASFAIVPVAFKEGAKQGFGGFKRRLASGAGVAVILSIVSFLFILALRRSGLVPVLNGVLFDFYLFAAVSGAVVVNRLKKLVVDPIAMRKNRTIVIAIGYAVGVPVTFFSGVAIMMLNLQHAIGYVYLSGYVVATLVTIIALNGVRSSDQLDC